VLLAQDLPDQALGLLARLHAVATVQGRTGSVIEIQALRALALAAAGEQADAVATLAEALTLAQSGGHVRVFADEGSPMARLLARLVAARGRDLIAAGLPVGYLSRLGAAIEPETARPGSPVHPLAGSRVAVIPGLIEALSERELEVLQLLAAGKANREIANELFVTPDTVKKHITHILGKLGATNRTEAAARARELGLVS
jgi:DNA-binding NarL/FixJ family response regulator